MAAQLASCLGSGSCSMALLSAWLIGCEVSATAQSLGAQRAASGQPDSSDYNGLDYTRPQQNAELRLQFRTSSSPTSETDQGRTYLKLATKLELPEGWNFGLQGQLPFVDKTTSTLNTTNVDRVAGVGDVFTQAVLSHSINSHWAFGFGARLVAPTAADSLGSGKWQIMPGFGV